MKIEPVIVGFQYNDKEWYELTMNKAEALNYMKEFENGLLPDYIRGVDAGGVTKVLKTLGLRVIFIPPTKNAI